MDTAPTTISETALPSKDVGTPADRPLCVDLDGTLIRTDTLLECVLKLLKQQPLQALQIPGWLVRGRAHFKRELAARVELDVARLPYHAGLLAFLRTERAAGRRLALVSAADESIVRRVAAHLGIFDEVIASDGTTNLKGERKGAALRDRYGADGYDYAGNDAADVPVWNGAHEAILVNASTRVRGRVSIPIARVFEHKRLRPRVLIKATRLQHWVKNLLVFVPVMMAHEIESIRLVIAAALAFLSFGLCASGIYLINDLLDLDADRGHPRKRHRPLASGALSLRTGMALAPLLVIAGVGVAALLPLEFLTTLLLYVVLTLSYSLRVKEIAILDVIVLAGLYTIRVIAGSAATGVAPSPWLLAFSLFFFYSLAMVKRYSELDALRRDDARPKATRGYYASDREQVASLGSASGYIAVLVLALYINSDAVVPLYRRPILLWMICPLLLYWISRVWLLAHRGQMDEDPVVFAIRDRVSYAVGACVVLVLFLAATGYGSWNGGRAPRRDAGESAVSTHPPHASRP